MTASFAYQVTVGSLWRKKRPKKPRSMPRVSAITTERVVLDDGLQSIEIRWFLENWCLA